MGNWYSRIRLPAIWSYGKGDVCNVRNVGAQAGMLVLPKATVPA
jgi:hypothetical protein